MSDIHKFLKQAAMQVGAGGSAGFIEVCIMHPLDLIKTRLQLQTKTSASKMSDPHYYNGMVDCMNKMYKYEGITSFWKGILPPILVETPKRALKFVTFEQYKKLFLFGSSTPTPLTFSLSGLCAGLTEGVLINPFEVVKVTLQTNKAIAAQRPGTWSVIRRMVREQGLGSRGLNKGLTATIARNGIFNTIFFGFYHSVKGYIPEYEDSLLEFGRKVAIGFTSGIIGTLVNTPFDVAKSRIQGPQPKSGVVKYSSLSGTLATMYREEGLRALYKGILPKLLRLGPGCAIMLVVYDYVYDFLENKFQSE